MVKKNTRFKKNCIKETFEPVMDGFENFYQKVHQSFTLSQRDNNLI